MADKKQSIPKNSLAPSKSSGSTLKTLAIILILLLVAGMGIGLAAFWKLKNSPELVNQWKLYDYPIIGSFLPRPKTNFETVELSQDIKPPAPLVMPPPPSPVVEPGKPLPPLSEAELAKQKAQQQETAKRIAKLARLYGGMKPEEAAPILNRLDDETVLAIVGKMEDEQVSKLLPLFEPQRAARLTQSILKGSK